METTNNENIDLSLKVFDLDETDGGRQMVLGHKQVNNDEHYLLTVGNGPKQEVKESETPEKENTGVKKFFNKQMLLNIRDHFVNKKNNEKEKENEKDDIDNFKYRIFKLTKQEGRNYLLQECNTPEAFFEAVKMFDFNSKSGVSKEDK